MPNLIEDIAKGERQWKRHVRIKYARYMKKTSDMPEIWERTLRLYGVRDNGSVLPSTTEQLERSIRNDERAASAKVALAEVSKE